MNHTSIRLFWFVSKTPHLKLSAVKLPRAGCVTIKCSPQRDFCLTHCQNALADSKFIPDEGIFAKTWRRIKRIFLDQSQLKATGYFYYESIADKINYIDFFKEMSMPDTFNSWFLITELHVWMLMAKAMEYGDDGRVIRNSIVEAMWNDVSTKARKLGPENRAAALEQVRELGDQFQAAILGYDEGILSDDRVLASALWRRFFERRCCSARDLENMVKYVRKQMHILDTLTEDDFRMRKIKWISLEEIRWKMFTPCVIKCFI